jgi:hypothetical protein
MSRLKVGFLVVVVLATIPQSASAQSNVSTGLLLGSSVDQGGAALPGVTVTATNVATGLARQAVTGGDGRYRVDLLPSGSYDVQASLPGFRTEVQGAVPVTLGSRVVVDFIMSPSAVEDEIIVTAEAPLVETDGAGIAAAVSDRAIADLPLQRRNFTDFTLLVPGTVLSDQEQVVGGRGGVNIGARQIQNAYNIDGANYHSSFFGTERGGNESPFTFSQAAIKEFQVIKSPTNLAFGAGGGTINAITKSGTNELHGQAFGYFTSEGMVAEDALGRKEEWDQKQYGFALGGPIVRDRLHFFTSLDRQDFLLPHFTEFHDFPAGREADWEALTGLDYETETANYDTTNDATAILLKLDWQLGSNHLLSGRYNTSTTEADNRTASLAWENVGLSNNGFLENSVDSLVFALSSVLTDRLFNEAFVQYGLERRPRSPNNIELPQTEIRRNRAKWGQVDYLPSWLDERRWQLVDNLGLVRGGHTLKAGANLDFVGFDNGFCRGCDGAYLFNDWEGSTGFLDNGTPLAYTQSFSVSERQVVYDTGFYSFYLQDEWRAIPRLLINYGVRYDLQDNDQPAETNPLWPATGYIPNDTDNWSIVAAFAWDLRGDGEQVLRGGFRRFYDITPTLLAGNAMQVNGINTVRLLQFCLFGDECPTYPDRWDSLGDAGTVTPDIYAFSPAFENPQTDRIWLGYERQMGSNLAIGIDLIYSETEKLERKQDQNLEPTDERTLDGRPVYVAGELYPDFDQIVQFTSDARADYTAVFLYLHKRFANNWFLDASYTWSDARDNDSNERSVGTGTGRTSDFAEDQYNLDNDWGPSAFDVRHKVVASLSWQLPYNFLVSAIAYYRSGYPYSAFDARDNNGDEYFNERALIDATAFHFDRNTERQPSVKNLDLRLSWTVRVGSSLELELIGEAFNLTNKANWYTSSASQVLVNNDGSINDYFGELDQVGPPRRFQLGARFRF